MFHKDGSATCGSEVAFDSLDRFLALNLSVVSLDIKVIKVFSVLVQELHSINGMCLLTFVSVSK